MPKFSTRKYRKTPKFSMVFKKFESFNKFAQLHIRKKTGYLTTAGFKTNYLKTNLLKQIKKISLFC